MEEKSEHGITQGNNQPLDLSELSGITMGPVWSESESSTTKDKFNKKTENKGPLSVSRRIIRRDRRPNVVRGGEKRAESRPQFQPTVDAIFYPEDIAFKTLIKAIRTSNKTYELFDITRLFLAKFDRFITMVRPAVIKDKNSERLYIALADGCPFESKEKAFDYSIENYIDEYFNIETETIDPPKGNFTMVNRCSFTGELLGPPNYHRYQELIVQHHAIRLPNIPYDSFVSGIETLKEQKVIEEWLIKMTKQTNYILKNADNSGESLIFDNVKSASKYLYDNKINKIVKPVSSMRISGKLLSSMPTQSMIRRSIEFHLEAQRRFPLETANHLRGRLRRLKINVYKKGSRGISYICAIKRNFQIEGQNFADSIQTLINFIVKTPHVKISDLEGSFLQINKRELTNQDSQNDERIHSESVDLPSEVKKRLHLMRQDLFWLISEGYVVEYEDGSLYASPPRSNINDLSRSVPGDTAELKIKESSFNSPSEVALSSNRIKTNSELKAIDKSKD